MGRAPLPRWRLGLASAIASALAQAAYWSRALQVAVHATIWDSTPYWTSGGAGSFFPWPREPGMLAVMTPMSNVVDQVIFTLITSNVYFALIVVTTVVFALLALLLGGLLRR